MEAAPSASASPATPAQSARALRTRAFRAAIELCRARIAASAAGRFARVVGVLLAIGAFFVAVAIRSNDGPAAPVGNLLRKTAIVIAWLAGGALAYSAARDRAAADRADGIAALAAARGVGTSLLRAARAYAVVTQIARAIGLPLAVVALGTAALAADVSTALRRVGAALALLAWAGVTGVTLGALASASARLFAARGPTFLVLFVIGERVAADALGLGAWSVPGALDAALKLLLGLTGVGGSR